ncbi:Protein FAM78A [Schistosoma japonicum]|uniref:Protein FAM78A n=1 Tax=Schistosoma japonicum TaxID=6182 RepID=A0A4Z2CWP0_SCHJA|nr:Protein FAM78A [Schistosoma japonicum]
MNKLTVDEFCVRRIRAYYDKTISTEIEETDLMLYYKTQPFYCQVEIDIPACISDSNWTIGLVQACDYMYLANDYNSVGVSLWEFHPLKSGLRQLINDSDGRQYPFYSVHRSLYNIKKGCMKKITLNLHIKDYFHPSVVWKLPFSGGVQLTEIIRQQKFLIWLVAIKYGKTFSCKDEITVFKQIRWEYNLQISVDPFMPLGSRIRKICDMQNNRIIVTNSDEPSNLPVAAIFPPHCNAVQSLIWYPKDMHTSARILVPPKQIIVPWEEWVRDMLGPYTRVCKPNEVFEIGGDIM